MAKERKERLQKAHEKEMADTDWKLGVQKEFAAKKLEGLKEQKRKVEEEMFAPSFRVELAAEPPRRASRVTAQRGHPVKFFLNFLYTFL